MISTNNHQFNLTQTAQKKSERKIICMNGKLIDIESLVGERERGREKMGKWRGKLLTYEASARRRTFFCSLSDTLCQVDGGDGGEKCPESIGFPVSGLCEAFSIKT